MLLLIMIHDSLLDVLPSLLDELYLIRWLDDLISDRNLSEFGYWLDLVSTDIYPNFIDLTETPSVSPLTVNLTNSTPPFSPLTVNLTNSTPPFSPSTVNLTNSTPPFSPSTVNLTNSTSENPIFSNV